MKKLLIDVDSILPLYSKGYLYGVGRSTYELVNALNGIEDIPFDITLFSHNMKGLGCRNLDTKYKKLHFYTPNRDRFNRISDSLKLRKLFSGYDLMHIPHNTDASENLSKTIYTIHDLIVFHYPEMWGLTDEQKKEIISKARKCKAIVTCSEASKQDIIKFLDVPEEKVSAIYWGINRDIFYPDHGEKSALLSEINDDFFFCASCNHPRKQPGFIVESFDEYTKNGGAHQMVMLKPYGLDLNKFKHLIERGSLVIVDNVSDTDLRWLYSNAKTTVIASLYEGFGFPVLESLACHTQVICSENSSLVEAGGNVVDYISAKDKNELTRKFEYYSSIAKEDSLDVRKAERHLESFTWKSCAVKYVSLWTKLLNF